MALDFKDMIPEESNIDANEESRGSIAVEPFNREDIIEIVDVSDGIMIQTLPEVQQQPMPSIQQMKEFAISEEDKKKFLQHKDSLTQMVSQVKELKVNTDKDNDLAISMSGKAQKFIKLFKAYVNEILEPHKTFVKVVNNFASEYLNPAETIVDISKKKSLEYARLKIIAEREAAEKEKARLSSLQTLIDATAQEAGVESITIPQAEAPKIGGMVRSSSGSSMSVKLKWKGFIVNPSEVPREYCSPDQKLIDAAVEGGMREIPGVRIEEVPEGRLRA